MTEWLAHDAPQRAEVGELTFVALSPALLDDDYAAVMHDIPMLRAWSNQDWPTATFTKDENLVDLVRHDREQRERIALTYSVLWREQVVGCIYVRPFADALLTREVSADRIPTVPGSDAVARGWAHHVPPATLMRATFELLRRAPFAFTRLWWQTNTNCPDQLLACDELELHQVVSADAGGTTWVVRSVPE